MFSHSTIPTLAILAGALHAQADSTTQAKLFSPNAVTPGSTVEIPLEVTPAATLHVYYINPGEMGQAVALSWTDIPEGFTFGELRFPAPHRVKTGELATNGYEEPTRFFSLLTISPSVPSGTYEFKAKASWLACNDSKCIPGSQEVSFSLEVAGTAATQPESFRKGLPLIPVDAGPEWKAAAKKEDGNWLIEVAPPADWLTDQKDSLGELDFFSETSDFFQPGAIPAITPTKKGLHLSVPASEYSDELTEAQIVLVGPTPPLRIPVPSISQ